MSIDFVKNKLCTTLVHTKSSPLCQLPCSAIKNVHETLKTCTSRQATILSISTCVFGLASAITGVIGATAANVALGGGVIACSLSTLSFGALAGLVGDTTAHYCVKKTIEHAASTDPQSENEQILPEIAEDISTQIVIKIEE